MNLGTNIFRLFKVLYDSDYRFAVLASRGFFHKMSDETYIKRKYRAIVKKDLNLKNPQMFCEKIQWLKLHDKNSRYTKMVDKYEAKKYVASIIGKQYIVPTLGVWERFEDIDFDKLPNRFVLKCTHDSGGLVICKNKDSLNKKRAKKKINKSLKRNYFYSGREWPYKKVVGRIIAEQYLEDRSMSEPRDYKFFCFNGEPKYCQVISNRSNHETVDFFDMQWNHQPFTGLALPSKPRSSMPISKPVHLNKMVEFSRELSKNTSFLRVDFYEVNGKLYFGELTFYPASGFGRFEPKEYNYDIGRMLDLHIVMQNDAANKTRFIRDER